jgi:hypothetical protein
VTEDAAKFDQVLSDIGLTGQKRDIIDEMKVVTAHLLKRANVRFYWDVDGYSETLPSHINAQKAVVAKLYDSHPSVVAQTFGNADNSDRFNETIELYPGTYDSPGTTGVDTETIALIGELKGAVPLDPALVAVATKVYGRLIGETLSHEVGHAILWDDIPGSGHNSPPITNDIMNEGGIRMFTQRTGMENTVMTSPVQASHYKDHGLSKIGGFQAKNQQLIDDQWPVPTAFK